MEDELKLGERSVGHDHPPFVIAEIGANHNGDMALARELIHAAKDSGADAAKFQSWSTRSLIGRAEYARNTEYSDKKRHFGSLQEMVERYQLTPEQHAELAEECRRREILFLSSCFAPAEVDLLDRLGVPAFKIASMDLNHLPLLEYVASKRKPVILSTGMGTLAEIERALATLRGHGSGSVVLLHCVSLYPPPPELLNLRNIPMLRERFSTLVGFSDHSFGTWAAVAAVALGARMLEKHFTLDKQREGWDHAISADPNELAAIVREARQVFAALGSAERTVSDQELQKRRAFRRRIVARRALPKGHVLAREDLDFKRPGTGIGPDELEAVVGRRLLRDVVLDDELDWSDLG